MRKYNLFGKKIFRINFLFIILFLMIIELGAHFLIINIQRQKIASLNETQLNLEVTINQLINQEENGDYLTISEMIPYLPTEVSSLNISEEFNIMKIDASITSESLFLLQTEFDVSHPFTFSFPNSFKSVRINLTAAFDTVTQFYDFLDNISNSTRFYYLYDIDATIYSDGSITSNFVIYTFYNQIY